MLVCPYSMIRFEFVEGQEPLLIFVILTSARFESVVNLLKADLKIPHIMTLELIYDRRAFMILTTGFTFFRFTG